MKLPLALLFFAASTYAAGEWPLPATWQGMQSSPQKEDAALAKSIEKMDWDRVCLAYGQAIRQPKLSRKAQAMRLYIEHANLFSSSDFYGASKKSVSIGMSTCGVIAAWGMPSDVNTTTRARSTSQQIIYRQRNTYVYTESQGGGNGIVRTIQD